MLHRSHGREHLKWANPLSVYPERITAGTLTGRILKCIRWFSVLRLKPLVEHLIDMGEYSAVNALPRLAWEIVQSLLKIHTREKDGEGLLVAVSWSADPL